MKSIASTVSVALLLAPSACFSFAPPSGRTSFLSKSKLNLMGPDELNTVSSSIAQADLLPTGVFDTMRDTISILAKEGGPPIMALAVAITDSVPLVPTQPVSVLAGLIFGLKFGLPAVVAGQTLATAFAFFFGRYVLRGSDWNVFEQAEGSDKGKLAKVLDELTAGLNSGDPKTVFLTILLARQTPVLPFSLGNYFVGTATNAPLLPVLAGTIVGCLPLNLVFVGAGAGGMAAVDMVKENGLLAEGLETVGVVATLALATFVAKIVMKVYSEDEPESTVESNK